MGDCPTSNYQTSSGQKRRARSPRNAPKMGDCPSGPLRPSRRRTDRHMEVCDSLCRKEMAMATNPPPTPTSSATAQHLPIRLCGTNAQPQRLGCYGGSSWIPTILPQASSWRTDCPSESHTRWLACSPPSQFDVTRGTQARGDRDNHQCCRGSCTHDHEDYGSPLPSPRR